MMVRTLALVCILLGSGIDVSSVRAFSDPERFVTPTEEGGGGERFFTGSRADGYTCAVCHRGGASPEVVIRGLPRDGYRAGQLYEVELAFRDQRGNHAVGLEMVDVAGRDLGLELLSDEQISPAERCGEKPSADRASYLTHFGKRRILGVEACEAREVRFRFRAPKGDQAILVATVLASDNSATIDGDGVTEIAQSIYRDGRPAGAAESGCSAAGPGALGVGWAALLLALTAPRTLRARRRTGR